MCGAQGRAQLRVKAIFKADVKERLAYLEIEDSDD